MGSSILHVHSSQHTYPIIIEPGCRKRTFAFIDQYITRKPTKYLIITDDNVAPLYLEDVVHSFPSSETVETYVVPSGEQSKSFKQYEETVTAALKYRLDRRSLIIALGGGVVGDLAGFVAASYMRGIPFIQIPTTLLAHDSSVGGKVGINHSLGKNMVGAFHQPSLVLYDPEALLSLPEREWRSGFAEVIKHGFIADKDLLEWLVTHVTSFQEWDMDILSEMLYRSIQVKANIVQEDEKEQGVRAFLNFGHTLGHAIEAEAGYGAITHGEAVAIGIVYALRLSEKCFEVNLQSAPYLEKLKSLGYQLDIPKQLSADGLLERMSVDKKAYNQVIRFVLLKAIGKPVVQGMSGTVLLDELKREVK
ncbi:3-dehydroquinate synthase [Evansella caseinilytica]|uniref:3-dehydroquinate synthase n=1 Tax=Evansella caseinilytica TaxID=1503961 RepID=A0A1H3NDZ5_9BACI|nr:3-dehydroquinate synthase [Evansella caseinilytica]SDY87161.1 3-dehydroquinate synthase [Evansella caseinilytica]